MHSGYQRILECPPEASRRPPRGVEMLVLLLCHATGDHLVPDRQVQGSQEVFQPSNPELGASAKI